MRKLGVGPDWYVNSAHAVTEDGTLVLASNTGSQLVPLAFGAGEVIFAIGSQKIVPDLATALRRIEEHTLPLEHARMQGLYGVEQRDQEAPDHQQGVPAGPVHDRADQGADRGLIEAPRRAARHPVTERGQNRYNSATEVNHERDDRVCQ